MVRGGLRLGGLGGAMMPDGASGGRAQHGMMTDDMPPHAADGSALQAALGIGWSGNCQRCGGK